MKVLRLTVVLVGCFLVWVNANPTKVIRLKPTNDTQLSSNCRECKAQFVVLCQKVEVTPDDIRAAKSIVLPNGETYTKRKRVNKEWSQRSFDFKGPDGSFGEVTIPMRNKTRNKEHITASFQSQTGGLFTIRNCGQDDHLFITMNAKKIETGNDYVVRPKVDNITQILDRDQPPLTPKVVSNWTMFNNENAQEALHALGRSSKKTAHVSVRVYYTQEYARVTNDITQEIEDMVAKANQAYKNSKIDLVLHLHCVEPFYRPENLVDGGKVLQNFESYKPTMGDLLGGADTAILLASKAIPDNDGGYTLGVAYNSWVFPVGFVCKAGAGTYLTFTHELAHMFSADHDQDTLNEQKSQPAVPYGRGLLVPGTNKHTIMAYERGEFTRGINFFTSDKVKDDEQDRLGNKTINNARLLQEMRFIMSSINDEKAGSCVRIKKPPTNVALNKQEEKSWWSRWFGWVTRVLG